MFSIACAVVLIEQLMILYVFFFKMFVFASLGIWESRTDTTSGRWLELYISSTWTTTQLRATLETAASFSMLTPHHQVSHCNIQLYMPPWAHQRQKWISSSNRNTQPSCATSQTHGMFLSIYYQQSKSDVYRARTRVDKLLCVFGCVWLSARPWPHEAGYKVTIKTSSYHSTTISYTI